jgi:CHASE2 domain-containing sensor protein/class 3 adenylate cyclase
MEPTAAREHLDQVTLFQRRHRAAVVTMLFTDIVGSTLLKQRYGDAEAVRLMQAHDDAARLLLRQFPQAEEISKKGDSFFIVFARPSDAVKFALQLQARLRRMAADSGKPVMDRIGIHVGEVLVEESAGTPGARDLFGMQVDTCARVMAAGGAGQILLTRFAFDNAQQSLKGKAIEGVGPLRWVNHGWYRFKGVDEPAELCEVLEQDQGRPAPPTNSEKAQRCPPPSRRLLDLPRQFADARAPALAGAAWRSALAGATFSALLGLALLVLPMGQFLTQASYDLPFLARRTAVPEEAVIIYMDDRSHAELNQPRFQAWDRSLHARLIEWLTTAGARAVVFDVLFDEPFTNTVELAARDQRLIAAARAHGRVALGAKLLPHIVQGEVIGDEPALPFDALRAVVTWGLVEHGDADKAVRQAARDDESRPSLAWRVARLTMESPPRLAAPRWLNYYGPPGFIANFSYCDALAGRVPAETFTGKVVYVGAIYGVGYTGGKGTDDYRTPYTAWTGRRAAGVEVNATSFLNLLRADWLRRTSPATEIVLTLVIGVVTGSTLVFLRPGVATLVAVAAAVVVTLVAMLLFLNQRLWFPWLVVVAVQLPAACFWSVLSHTRRLRGEKRALEERLQRLRDVEGAPAPAAPQPAGPPLSTQPNSPPPIPDHDLIRLIGRGAYGEVWLARDAIGTYHAVKIVHRRTFTSDAPYEREFRGIEKFTPISRSHPGLVAILHVGRNNAAGYFYYIMELGDSEEGGQTIHPDTYQAETLARKLARQPYLPAPECVRLGLRLADALMHLHRHGLVHRDIKPSNIIFVEGRPKFADIGLVTEAQTRPGDSTFVGTEGFIAPEGPGTKIADLFSLGKVLYEASMGRDRKRFPELPTTILDRPDKKVLLELNHVLLKACDDDPRARYQSAAEMHADLQRIADAMDQAG